MLDSQTSLAAVAALTALTQCIVARALSEKARGPYDRELATENKFRAARHGLNADFYDKEKGISVPARESARALVDELRPVSQYLGCEDELSGVTEIVDGGTGSQHQRRVYLRNGDFLEVVSYLIDNTHPAMSEAPVEASEEQR